MKILHSVMCLVLVLPGLAAGAVKFHHIHMLAQDPAAATEFYCSRFPCQGGPAIVVDAATEIKTAQTAFWHLGFGVPDIRREYIRQLDLGTPFRQPLEYLTGDVYFAYAAGPHDVQVEIIPMKTEGLSHIHLYSAHPTVAGEWYVRHLGMRATRPLEVKPLTVGRYTLSSAASLDLGGVNFSIFPKPEDVSDLAPTEGTAVDHLGFQVDSLDQAVLDLRKSGARILAMPRQTRPGERTAFVQGPDRMKIELIEISR